MRDLREPFEWLKEARTVNLSYNVTDPNVGLKMTMAQMIVASGRKPYFYLRIDPNHAAERMEIDFLLSKSKTGRRKNIIPLEVKSTSRFSHVSLDKFLDRFGGYVDRPLVASSRDFSVVGCVEYIPLYAVPAVLETI